MSVVELHVGPSRPTTVVRQRDLEEYFYLLRQRREADRVLGEIRERIKSALEQGAAVEPGVHTAALKPSGSGVRLVVW